MKKKILSIALSLAMLVVCAVPAFAANNVKTVDSGIMAVQTASEIADFTEGEASLARVGYSINWTLASGQASASTAQMVLPAGGEIDVDIKATPAGSSLIGLLDNNTGQVSWVTSFTTGISGTITVNQAGNYSLALGNASSGAITYTGTFFY